MWKRTLTEVTGSAQDADCTSADVAISIRRSSGVHSALSISGESLDMMRHSQCIVRPASDFSIESGLMVFGIWTSQYYVHHRYQLEVDLR